MVPTGLMSEICAQESRRKLLNDKNFDKNDINDTVITVIIKRNFASSPSNDLTVTRLAPKSD